MVPTHPVAIELANEYAKDIPRRSGRHEKKAPAGRPSVRSPVRSPVRKDTNLSDISSSSEDDSDRASTVQAQVVHKMTRATSTNLARVLTRTRSTTATKRKYAKKGRPPPKRRQPSRQVVKRSKRKK